MSQIAYCDISFAQVRNLIILLRLSDRVTIVYSGKIQLNSLIPTKAKLYADFIDKQAECVLYRNQL